MSVSFCGRSEDGSLISIDIEDPVHLNMSCANARAFLLFLGIEPGQEPMGEISMPEARRAIIRARATFDRRVVGFTRERSDTKRPGKVRVITEGIEADYFEMRLRAFERFIIAVTDRGAKSVYWA